MSGDDAYKYNGQSAEFLERYISSMNVLIESEGWKYMQRDLKSAEQTIIDGMASTSNPNEMIRAAGKLTAIRTQLNWPSMMLNTATDHLRRVREANKEKR